MSQKQKLEQVLDLLLSEDSDQAAELLHQIIVEKARTIYESIVDEESDDEEDKEAIEEGEEVGGEPSDDFTNDIADAEDEIESDEENDGEADDSEEDDSEESGEDEFGGEAEGSTEDRVEDLESQLAELRAEFDALMGEEMQEPNHADLGDEMGEIEGEDDFGGEQEMPSFGGEEQVVGEVVATMFEKKKAAQLEVAKQAKKGDLKKKGEKKVDEETKFTNAVADTGQKGTAKLAGTGKGTPLGAEQNQSPYTHAPSKKEYGGGPVKIGSGTGGEYGKYNGETATSKTPTDNVNIKPKSSSIKADTTAKYTGGKPAGEGFTKSPLSRKPT